MHKLRFLVCGAPIARSYRNTFSDWFILLKQPITNSLSRASCCTLHARNAVSDWFILLKQPITNSLPRAACYTLHARNVVSDWFILLKQPITNSLTRGSRAHLLPHPPLSTPATQASAHYTLGTPFLIGLFYWNNQSQTVFRELRAECCRLETPLFIDALNETTNQKQPFGSFVLHATRCWLRIDYEQSQFFRRVRRAWSENFPRVHLFFRFKLDGLFETIFSLQARRTLRKK